MEYISVVSDLSDIDDEGHPFVLAPGAEPGALVRVTDDEGIIVWATVRAVHQDAAFLDVAWSTRAEPTQDAAATEWIVTGSPTVTVSPGPAPTEWIVARHPTVTVSRSPALQPILQPQ